MPDLSAAFPTEPALLMKGDHTIIGPGDTIELPQASERATAEGELGAMRRENVVASMTFPPVYLVSFHSRVMTLYPGDIIGTGTPGPR